MTSILERPAAPAASPRKTAETMYAAVVHDFEEPLMLDEVEKLLPYVVPPDNITPGVATWYTTVCGECPTGCGVWARTREGRGRAR